MGLLKIKKKKIKEKLSNSTVTFYREFAARLLVPLLKQSPYTANLKLLAFDDVREHLLSSTNEVLPLYFYVFTNDFQDIRQ